MNEEEDKKEDGMMEPTETEGTETAEPTETEGM
jgi:hypothetical protein